MIADQLAVLLFVSPWAAGALAGMVLCIRDVLRGIR